MQLLDFLQKDKSKHCDFLRPVVVRNEAAPSFFRMFTSETHPGKKVCFNSITKDWMLNGGALLKAGELKEGECPCLKPSTFITCTQGFSSELQSHSAHFNIESGFEGKGEFGKLASTKH